MSFEELSPYETLKVTTSATLPEIKKSYRKLCLLHHPDKLTGKSFEQQESSKNEFERIQFSYMILSDEKKRKRYDATGSIEEVEDSEFDWMDYFNSVKTEINEEMIKKDKEVYQGSEDEAQDIIESWVETKGDFLQLFEMVPHVEVTKEDESRLFDIVLSLVKEGVLESTTNWVNYQKKRTIAFKKYLKSQKDESKEAEELKKELLGKQKVDTEDDLRQLIQAKNKNGIDDLIARLENKYTRKKTTKRSKQPAGYDIPDDEFENMREKVVRRKKTKRT